MKRVYTAIENDDDDKCGYIELIIIGARERETSTADASFNGRVPIFIDKDKFPIRPTKNVYFFSIVLLLFYISTPYF